MTTTTEIKHPFNECMKVFASLDNKKISKMIMTKYEFNLVISQRTVQLSQGFCPFVKIDSHIKSNMDLRIIALEELKQGKIPFIIKRPLPNEKYEFVRVKDLDLSAVKYMIDL
jgi:DNA-directed RNA polymerase subunit K/omega